MIHCRFCNNVPTSGPSHIKSPVMEQSRVICPHCGAHFTDSRMVTKAPLETRVIGGRTISLNDIQNKST